MAVVLLPTPPFWLTMATTVLTAGILSRGQPGLFIPRPAAAWLRHPLSGDTEPVSPEFSPELSGSAASPPPSVAWRPAPYWPPSHPTPPRPAHLHRIRLSPPGPSWLRRRRLPRAGARSTRRVLTTWPPPWRLRCRRYLAAPAYDRRPRPWH